MIKIIIRSVLFLALIVFFFGIGYPYLMITIANIIDKDKAKGSLIYNSKGDIIIGSKLIGQEFISEKYLWSRPSLSKYNPIDSGEKVKHITSKRFSQSLSNNQNSNRYLDGIFNSSSGLDPHVSLQNAKLQIERIASKRGINFNQVEKIIENHIVSNPFSNDILVEVLLVNIELDRLYP